METIRKRMVLGESEYYRTHLRIITSLMPAKLTDRELEVLAEFMSFDGDFAKDRFGTSQRKIVMERLKMKAPNLSTLLKGLELKGIIKDGNILPIFLPEKGTQRYEFVLTHDK